MGCVATNGIEVNLAVYCRIRLENNCVFEEKLAFPHHLAFF
jgi:hypothetical protein